MCVHVHVNVLYVHIISFCTLQVNVTLSLSLSQDHLNTVNWLAVFCDEVQVIKVQQL